MDGSERRHGRVLSEGGTRFGDKSESRGSVVGPKAPVRRKK